MQNRNAVHPSFRLGWMLLLLTPALGVAQESSQQSVSALGRLEPENGVIRVSASSTPYSGAGSVVMKLHVKEHDWVEQGQLLAETDSTPVLKAQVKIWKAELELAIRAAVAANSRTDEVCALAKVADSEATRRTDLLDRKLASDEEAEQAIGNAEAQAASCMSAHANADVAQSAIQVVRAGLEKSKVELERSMVRAPMSGRVLEIYAWPGEFTVPDGVLALGRTDRMFAIAEVYETDIKSVRVGQTARIFSKLFAQPLTGKVEHIHKKVRRQYAIGTDPTAREDARIIEVKIRLDDNDAAANLINLQVQIVIDG